MEAIQLPLFWVMVTIGYNQQLVRVTWDCSEVGHGPVDDPLSFTAAYLGGIV